jgi:hypothetical protein
VVYAARQLACDALETQARPSLPSLVPELADWMGDLLGPGQAQGALKARVAGRRAAGI